MRRFSILTGLLLLITGAQVWGQAFKLEEISDRFPSRGFEDQIHFWEKMFTRFGERDIVFHDADDLRITYAVLTFERGIEGNPTEVPLQRDAVRRKSEEIRSVLTDLAEGREEGVLHREILEQLRSLGYDLQPSLHEKLRENLRSQRGLCEKFRAGIERSGRYLAEMERIFSERGMPVELALLPHVESSFQYHARSSVGATGIWQIVRSTGRPYLTINTFVDERLDPLRATRAAADILSANYQALQSWPLAVTAYNYGLNGMRRAQREHGSDLREIIEHYETRLFGFASRNFYAEFLAAVEVHRNSEKYFEELSPEAPLRFETVQLRQNYRLADLLGTAGVDEEVFRDFNPALTNRAWKEGLVPSGFEVQLPPGLRGSMEHQLQRSRPVSLDFELGDGEIFYRVRNGDSLSGIARKFNVSVGVLQRANRISNPHQIQVGKRLVIPDTDSSRRRITYRVKTGDTLYSIAQKFGTSWSQIRRLNQIDDPHQIRLGQELIIP